MIGRAIVKGGQIQIWPLLFWGALALLIASLGASFSAGLPWGVDDGVKRLMARSWASSAGMSVMLPDPEPPQLSPRFFPIPPPFAAHAVCGFWAIFPALYPSIGGALYAVLGNYGFYLLPALSVVLLLFFWEKMARAHFPLAVRVWALLIPAGAVFFYAFTFWEHGLALLLLLPLFGLLMGQCSSHNPPSAPPIGMGGTQSPPFVKEDLGGLQIRRLRAWQAAGLCFGLAVALRPETALLLPWLFLLLALGETAHSSPDASWRPRNNLLLGFMVSGAVALAIACGLEKAWAGRWLPPQVSANLDLALSASHPLARLEQTMALVWNAPLPWGLYAAVVIVSAILALMLRKPLFFALSLPVLSLIAMLWGWQAQGAYALVADSQGLFFALPWLGVSLLKITGQKRRNAPFFVLGWGYMLLAYLVCPDQPGMHWGPRFLFPALLPLLLHAMMVLRSLTQEKTARILMLATGLATLLNAAMAWQALAARGEAGAQVLSVVRASPCDLLILDRWHAGADLEALWGEKHLLWVEGREDFEELLIALNAMKTRGKIGWLKQQAEFSPQDFPLQVRSRTSLPDRGGWRGELLEVELADASDLHWADVYWHAARRRAELPNLAEALCLFKQAVFCLPENPDLRYDLALCLGKMGRIEEARSELQAVLQLDPKHAAARHLWERLTSP